MKVGMYIRGNYYQYRGKIGIIIKNYHNDLEIAYKDGVIKTNPLFWFEEQKEVEGKIQGVWKQKGVITHKEKLALAGHLKSYKKLEQGEVEDEG